MARTTIDVTLDWQKIASGEVVITAIKNGAGSLRFNETASDVDAYVVLPGLNDQFSQTEPKDTYVRATGLGWDILVDGIL